MNYLDSIVYINLDKRTDRREHIQKELKKINADGLNISRFSAIQKPFGGLGCCLSHLEILQDCLQNNNNHTMILEDDAEFLVSREELDKYISLFLLDTSADVLCLGYCSTNDIPHISNFIIDDAGHAIKLLLNNNGLPLDDELRIIGSIESINNNENDNRNINSQNDTNHQNDPNHQNNSTTRLLNENNNENNSIIQLLNENISMLEIGRKVIGEISEKYKFRRTFHATTTSCYITKAHILKPLILCFHQAAQMLENCKDSESSIYKQYAIDQAWIKLQQLYTFVIPNVRCVKQYANYSDIANKHIARAV